MKSPKTSISCLPHPIQRASGALGAGEPFVRRIEARCVDPALGLDQESGGLLAFGLAAWVFAVSAFTRPVSATTCGAAVIGSHPGRP